MTMAGDGIRHNSGFTLIELLTAVALLGILLALATPSFSGLAARMRIQSAANSLSVALATARTEAVKLGRNVAVCKSSNGANCELDGDWSIGWLLYATPGVAIKVFDGPSGGMTMVGDLPVQNTLVFTPTGASTLAGTANIVICVSAQMARVISISPSGRIRVTEGEVCP